MKVWIFLYQSKPSDPDAAKTIGMCVWLTDLPLVLEIFGACGWKLKTIKECIDDE